MLIITISLINLVDYVMFKIRRWTPVLINKAGLSFNDYPNLLDIVNHRVNGDVLDTCRPTGNKHSCSMA